MLFKLSNLNSNLALTLGYLNPALNDSALTSETSTSASKAGAHNSKRAFTNQINLASFWSTFSRKSGSSVRVSYCAQ